MFSRKIWTEALINKRPATAAAAFKKILNKTGSVPAALINDGGMEFSAEFKELLETKGIVPRQKDKDDINAIATLDTGIGSLNKALVRGTRKAGTDNWASRLER